jgi:hypothetical protein
MKKIILFIITLPLFSLFMQGQKTNNKDIEKYPIPKNLEQCFKLLDKTMTDEEIFLIKSLQEDSIYFHKEFQYGTDFFHTWKIYDGSRLTRYFNKKGLYMSFEIYETILVSYHRYLNNIEINLAEQIAKYDANRQQETLAFQQKQDSIQSQEPLNKIIISSINSYIISDKDLVKQGFSLSDTSRYYICMDGLPADFPYDSIQNATFFSLKNIEGVPNVIKRKLKKGIGVLFVGIKISNNQLVITVAGRGVKRIKKRHISIVIGDWGIFTYEYSCEKQEWLLSKTEYGGI